MHHRIRSAGLAPQHGFTLIEALITVTIVAILMTWAVPSLYDFVTRNRMSTEVNTLVTSLYLARSEAVKRLRNVSLCPANSDFTDCSGSNWSAGWIVYSEIDGNKRVLQQNIALPPRFSVKTARAVITFTPTGRTTGGDTFVFCDTGAVAETREVILSSEGRVRTLRHNTSGCA